MKGRSPTFKQLPLDIVGSTKFGRYPKISVEQTYNMIISDGFLVPYAGHMQVASIVSNAQGRAIYTSVRYGHMIVVIGNLVYSVASNLSVSIIGSIATYEGDVYIDENNTNQIAICDKNKIYIYNYVTGAFTTANIDFIPGYITYQNGRFVAASLETAQWRLSNVGDGTTWPDDSFHVGLLQTKPDTVVATQRVPSRGNLLYVFGNTVTEIWQDAGLNLFPYQKNSSVNIDYGCLNAATIAYNDTIVVWLAANEKSGPMIAYSMGGDIKKISTDGIDFQLTQLTNPSNSYGFLFRQDGHLIYQITFIDDNITYIYDFNTEKFFTLSDENVNAHIAKRVAFFNDNYYFVSFIDGNLYEMSTTFTTYNGKEIPRFRICSPIRLPDASRFSIPNLTFTIEQGTQDNTYFNDTLLTEDGQPILTEDGQPLLINVGGINMVDGIMQPIPQRVGLSVSKNGGQSFGTIWMKELNPRGLFRNRLNYWQLGAANDLTVKIQFWGLSRFVATDGVVNIFQ